MLMEQKAHGMHEGLVESEVGLGATPEDTREFSQMPNGNVVDIRAAADDLKAPRMLMPRCPTISA